MASFLSIVSLAFSKEVYSPQRSLLSFICISRINLESLRKSKDTHTVRYVIIKSVFFFASRSPFSLRFLEVSLVIVVFVVLHPFFLSFFLSRLYSPFSSTHIILFACIIISLRCVTFLLFLLDCEAYLLSSCGSRMLKTRERQQEKREKNDLRETTEKTYDARSSAEQILLLVTHDSCFIWIFL